MIAFARKLDSMIDSLRQLANNFVAPILDLTIRLFMANIFLNPAG